MLEETTKEIILALAARAYFSPNSPISQPDDALLHSIHLMGKEKDLIRYDWEELLTRLNKIITKHSGNTQ